MVRFPDSETDEKGLVVQKEPRPIIERSDDIGTVTEGPIVGALVLVFRQLGAKRHGRDQ